MIEAILTNRLAGEFSGPVNVMVTTNLYSHDHQHILLPQGTQILGEASKVSLSGQRRLAVTFHRAITPDGYSIDLEKFGGLDQQGGERAHRPRGYTLAEGDRNRRLDRGHWSLSEIGGTGIGYNPLISVRVGAGEQSGQEATQILSHALNVLPTVTVASRWFDGMASAVQELGVSFTAIGVVTPDPASVESVCAWGAALQDRADYLIVENANTDPADFSYWNDSAEARRFRDAFHPREISIEYRLTKVENPPRQHGFTMNRIADRKVEVPELQQTTVVIRAQAYRRNLFAELDRVKDILLASAALLLRSSTNEITVLSNDISAVLKPVAHEYQAISAVITREVSSLLAASVDLRHHNSQLVERERTRDLRWQSMLAALFVLLGMLCGILTEKRPTRDALLGMSVQMEHVHDPVVSPVPPNTKNRQKGVRGRTMNMISLRVALSLLESKQTKK